MKEIARIKIPADVCSDVEARNFELIGMRNLVLAAERVKTPEQPYNRITKDYLMAKAEFDMAMEALRSEYVPKKYQKPKYRFGLDYQTSEIVITEVGANARK